MAPDQNPQKYDWLHVRNSEEIQWMDRPSIYPTAAVLVITGVLSVICIIISYLIGAGTFGLGIPPVFSLVPFGVIIIMLTGAAWKLYNWKNTYYVLTTQEIYKKQGIISRNVTQIGHSQIQNTKFNQSILERLLSFSDISIYTAGTDMTEMVLQNVPNPSFVHDKIGYYKNNSRSNGVSNSNHENNDSVSQNETRSNGQNNGNNNSDNDDSTQSLDDEYSSSVLD